jgi:hypothetical protein
MNLPPTWELEIKQRQLIIDIPENLAGFELKLVVWLSAMATAKLESAKSS